MGSIRILKASAGSGKTYRLAYEYVRNVITEPQRYRHILAVTFTNKATEEMKQRIISEIHILASGAASNYLSDICTDLELSADIIRERARIAQTYILHDYSHFAVLTIDKFFQRIIRSFIKELGIDLNFNLELQTDTLLSSATDALIEDISTDPTLREWIIAFIDEKIDQNRKWDVKKELMSLGGEIFKESYKSKETQSIDKKLLNAIVGQSNTEARAAKDKMQSTARQALKIISDSGLSTDDFLGGRNGFANYFNKIAAGEIVEYGKRVSDALNSDDKWCTKTSAAKALIINAIPSLRPLLEQLCALYDNNIRHINSASLLSENYRNFALLSDLSTKITELCAKSSIMPISETNHILRQLIAGNDTPFIFEKVGNNFSHFMIDEFQDTSAMQWDNFVPLLHNALSQSDENPVLLVGDVKQSIYRWRGGDWQILGGKVDKIFSNVAPEILGTNYRSMRNVVEFNNNIVQNIVNLDNEALNNQLDEAHAKNLIDRNCRAELTNMLSTAYENQSQKPRNSTQEGYINITFYGKSGDDERPIPPVIAHIEDLQRRGFSPSDIAILVRYNKQGIEIANMLLDHKSSNPSSPFSYDVVTAEALTIGASPVIGFIAACLHLSANGDDPIKKAIFNRWFDRAVYEPIDDRDIELLHSLCLLSPEEAFEQILIHFDLGNRTDDVAYIQAFHQQIINFCNTNIADIQLFLKWWEDKGRSQSVNIPKSNSAITIISIHKAKGLEYKAVIIPYCNWELPPKSGSIIWTDTQNAPYQPIAQLDRIPVGIKQTMGESYFAQDYYKELILSHIDNINTFYVATTRAREELHIMMPQAKKSSGKISSLIVESLNISGESSSIGEMSGTVKDDGISTVVEFGTPIIVASNLNSDNTSAASSNGEKTGGTTLPTNYTTRSLGAKVRLRQRLQRYFSEDEAPATLSPRNYGVLMHKLFEDARSTADITIAMQTLRQSGMVSNDESTLLQTMVDAAMQNTKIKDWFSDTWDSVRTENEIITPHDSSIKRPDRVMIKGKTAVVVDYKFGLNRTASHAKQIREYMELLSQMGYTDVSGYLWYVAMNDIEQI